MRKITEIFVHCSDTPPDWMAGKSIIAKVAEIRRWHIDDNKWLDIGYHYVIDRDGGVAKGRADSVAGAHVFGHNKNSLGIVLIGGKGGAATDNFEDHFTAAQDASLRHLLTNLQSDHPGAVVRGHNEVAARECPCFTVQDWLAPTEVAKAEAGLIAFVRGLIQALERAGKRATKREQ